MREPAIGARFRRMSINPLSGEPRGYIDYTVVAIEPKPPILSQRVVLRSDTGREARPDLEHLYGGPWEAIENVVALRPTSCQDSGKD